MPTAPPDAAWREKRRLASELRALAALCVTTDAPEATLSYAADAVGRIVERLAQHPQRTFREGIATCRSHEDLARFADRGTMTGLSNPHSPPMELSMEGDHAIGCVTFGPPFEGIPGHVHGGLVAAAFDQVFGYLQVKLGAGAVTGELTVRYRRPTPLLDAAPPRGARPSRRGAQVRRRRADALRRGRHRRGGRDLHRAGRGPAPRDHRAER